MCKKKNKRAKHPIQLLVYDRHGVIRFKENKIVQFVLAHSRVNMIDIAINPMFSHEDRIQFEQLLGCSLSYYGDLEEATDKDYKKAEKQKVHKE